MNRKKTRLNTTLFIGNDINNLVPGNSWSNLLDELKTFCCVGGEAINNGNKPFPLLYEEIFLRSLRTRHQPEIKVKEFISRKFLDLKPGAIHERIMGMEVANIVTTNYDFLLEGKVPGANKGVIAERLYSVFRHSIVNDKKVWHAHGDCRSPASINLGFEHYGGQLQQIRNYVATGTNYTTQKLPDQLPFITRWERGKINGHSWTELFFTDHLYIFGFSLDFVETDIWWLLTFRARQLFALKKPIRNKIYYFVPTEWVSRSREKLDLLEVNGVEVIGQYPGKDKAKYYAAVLSHIEKGL
jgi:hypothetical protein